MAPETCRYLDSAVQGDEGQRCLLKAKGKITMNEMTAKHYEMGVITSVYLNDICPFGDNTERQKCPWFIEVERE